MSMRFLSRAAFFCYLLTLAALTPLLIATPLVEAQRCQVLEFTPDYPATADPGQTVQVNTTLGVACAQWRTWYGARIDLVDKTSKNILSSSYFDIGWRPVVNGTVSNTATAPQTTGSWGLILTLYLFEGGDYVGSSSQSLNIQVGAPAVTTQQTTSSNVISISPATTSESSMATQSSVQTSSAASPLILSPNFLVPAALIGVIIVLAVALLKTRKRNA